MYMCEECKYARFCSTGCTNAFKNIHVHECKALKRCALANFAICSLIVRAFAVSGYQSWVMKAKPLRCALCVNCSLDCLNSLLTVAHCL